jgi:hypothetical protein
MPTIQVKNSATGAMGTKAAQRSRYEKAETAFGVIPAAAYAIGDTLSLDHSPMKSLIHAEFVAGTTALEIFHGADLSSPVVWDILQTNGVTADINYVVTYIRGTGNVNTSTAEAGEGVLIRLNVQPPVATVTTVSANSILATSATLRGTVDPNGAAATTVEFQYGTTTGVYTTTVAAAQSPLAWGTTGVSVSKGLTGLTTGTQYFFRVKATTVSGIVYGSELNFTTS